eukprot:scaffold133458_cov96-Phaeocystis_antarctica.AAC.2
MPRLLIAMSVFGCRLPRVSRHASSTSRPSGSASSYLPLATNSRLRRLMEKSVLGCRLPSVSRCTSSASRDSGSAAAR